MEKDNNSTSQNRQLSPITPGALTPKTNLPSDFQEIKQPSEPSETTPSEEVVPKANLQKQNLKNLISDIDNSEKINELLTGTPSDKLCNLDLSISTTINQTSDTLKSINVIKDELCKLPLDPCEMDYINISINPLLNMLQQLSSTAYNLVNSSSLLVISPIVNAKNSELKDTIHLVYKINEQCEDIYEVLKKRINLVIKNND